MNTYEAFGRMPLSGEKLKYSVENCPTVNLSTIDPTRTYRKQHPCAHHHYILKYHLRYMFIIQDDKKFSVHPIITIQ
jgi:hypothetical protein